MPKVTDVKAYWADLAKKNGIPEDRAKLILEALDDDATRKAITEGFKPLPDYSHDLDEVRTKTEAKKDEEYRNWQTEEMVKYNTYVAGIDKLKAYEEKFGPLEGERRFLDDQNRGGNMLTKEDVDKMRTDLETQLEARLARRDAATLEFMDVREAHMNTFKKSLDVKGFEEAWRAHPEWGGSVRIAYEKFFSPEMEKIREAQFKDEAERRYQEGVRDGFSRRAIPVDSQPKHFSPMFDKDPAIEKMNEGEQERLSRQSFFEGLTEKQPA